MKIKLSLNGAENGDMTNTAQPASDIPRSWPDASKLTGKIPFDPNQSAPDEDKVDLTKDDAGNAALRNGDETPGPEGKPSRPDENMRTGARVTNEVESTHCDQQNTVGNRSFQELFGNIFADLFADRRVQRTMSRVADEMDTQSLSKGRSKSAKLRSQMLKMVMPELSREQGERLANAIEEHDGETVKRIMTQIGVKLGKRVSQKK